MEPPAWNPGGLNPSVIVPRGAESWTDEQSLQFKSDGTDQVWTYHTPVFDLRPGVTLASSSGMSAVPINHEAALGQSIYVILMIFSRSGATPIALRGKIQAFYWEDGNNTTPYPMHRLTEEIEVSDTLYAGGTTIQTTTPDGNVIVPGGASVFSFSPCVPGMHFWRVGLKLVVAGTTAVTNDYCLRGAVH